MVKKQNINMFKRSNRVLLAPPHSGVLFWLLSSSALNRSIRSSFNKEHPYFGMYGGYFKNVFGQNPTKILDEVISLTLLYDELLLPPTDIHLPGYEGSPGRYEDKELNIVMDWQWRLEVSKLLGQTKVTDWLLSSPKIQQLLQNTPDKYEVAWNCVVLLYISQRFDASIIGDKITIQLLKTVKSVLEYKFTNPDELVPEKESAVLTNLFDIAGLCFCINDIDEYRELRNSKPLKCYGDALKNFLNDIPEGKLGEKYLYESLMETIEREELANKISGGLSISASLLGVASLIPVVGTVTGLIGLPLDLGSRAAEQIAGKKQWWALAPEISRTLTKHRIERKLKELSDPK